MPLGSLVPWSATEPIMPAIVCPHSSNQAEDLKFIFVTRKPAALTQR